MIRALRFTPIALVLTMLPGVASALLVQVNDQNLPYERSPLVTYQAGERLFVIDSGGDYRCAVDEPATLAVRSDRLRLRIDGAEVDLLGNVSLTLEEGLPRLSIHTAEGSITCSKNRIFRDRFVAASDHANTQSIPYFLSL